MLLCTEACLEMADHHGLRLAPRTGQPALLQHYFKGIPLSRDTHAQTHVHSHTQAVECAGLYFCLVCRLNDLYPHHLLSV